jgi:hypothetical protein
MKNNGPIPGPLVTEAFRCVFTMTTLQRYVRLRYNNAILDLLHSLSHRFSYHSFENASITTQLQPSHFTNETPAVVFPLFS